MHRVKGEDKKQREAETAQREHAAHEATDGIKAMFSTNMSRLEERQACI